MADISARKEGEAEERRGDETPAPAQEKQAERPEKGEEKDWSQEGEQGLFGRDLRREKSARRIENQNEGQQNYVEHAAVVNNFYGGVPIGASPSPKAREFDLSSPKGVSDFFSAHAASQPLALAVIMGVIPIPLPVGRLAEMTNALLDKLPDHPDEEERKSLNRDGAYVATEGTLALLGAERGNVDLWGPYGKTPTPAVILGNEGMRLRIRECLWFSYPMLREPVVAWLCALTRGGDLRIADGAARALGQMALLDQHYAHTAILPALKKGPNRALCGATAEMSRDESCRPAIEKMYEEWAVSPLWHVPILAFARGSAAAKREYVRDAVEHAGALFIEDFSPHWGEFDFLAEELLRQPACRAAFAQGLRALFGREGADGERVAMVLLQLLARCYLRLDANKQLLPLAAFPPGDAQREEVAEALAPLLRRIVRRQMLREALWTILTAYMDEIDECGKSAKPLFRFFRLIAFTGDERDYHTVSSFLRRRAQAKRPSLAARELLAWLSTALKALRAGTRLVEGASP